MSETLPEENRNNNGFYGRAITTEMRRKLPYQAVYILDFFQGIWRKAGAKVYVSNETLSKEFGWSIVTTKRALRRLEEQGFIIKVITDGHKRVIVPGGMIIQGKAGSGETQGGVTCDPGGGQERPRGWVMGDPHKTYKYKTNKSKTSSPNFPNLFFTDEERTKLKTRYREEALPLKRGLEILQGWSEDNPKEFSKKKSHYRCLIGWVLKEVRSEEKSRLDLERSEMYHDKASKH